MIGVSCAILILLFFFQRLGTSKLGHCFAPIIILWFFANFCVGIYNIVTWHPGESTFSPGAVSAYSPLMHCAHCLQTSHTDVLFTTLHLSGLLSRPPNIAMDRTLCEAFESHSDC